jgi:copper chaperone CopZ
MASRPDLGDAPSEFTLSVDGMSCGGCVKGVTRAIGRVPEVAVIAVDIGSARLQVRVGADRDRARDAAARAIEAAGFEVR